MEFLWLLALLVVIAIVIYLARRDSKRGKSPGTAAPMTSPQSADSKAESGRLASAARDANSAPFAGPFQPPAGRVIFGGSRDAAFAGRSSEYSQIAELVTALIRDSPPDESQGLRWSADRYPPELSDQIDHAVGLKRAGEFLASAQAYDAIIRSSGVVYSGIIRMLYKVVAASGALRSANQLLDLGQEIFMSDAKSLENLTMFGGPSAFESDRSELMAATASRDGLEQYLRGISGNANYRLIRDYSDAVRELQAS